MIAQLVLCAVGVWFLTNACLAAYVLWRLLVGVAVAGPGPVAPGVVVSAGVCGVSVGVVAAVVAGVVSVVVGVVLALAVFRAAGHPVRVARRGTEVEPLLKV